MQAMLSREVGPSQQGQLQGAISSMRGITGMMGPLLFTQVFSLAIDGAPIHAPPRRAVSAGLPLVPAALVVAAAVSRRVTPPSAGTGPAPEVASG